MQRSYLLFSNAIHEKTTLDNVEDLNLPPKVESKLTGPIDKTITFLNDNNPNNDNGSCGQLNAFKVEVAKPKNRLDQATQDELIAIAEAIQNNLGCSN